MRAHRRTLFALIVAGAAAAACSDQPTSAPTEATPPRAAVPGGVNATWIPTVCDITQLRSDARAFVARSNDVLLTIVGDLSTEVGRGRARNATEKAFDGLARIAAVRGTGDQDSDVTAEEFDRLVKGFLACMESAVTANALEPDPPGPSVGFGLALGSNWVFEVRGGANDPTGGAFQTTKDPNPPSWWVLEPGGSDWASSIGGSLRLDRVFIYGYQTSTSLPAGVGSSFDHLTIPRITPPPANNPAFSMSVDIALCSEADVTPTSRLNHDNVFVPLKMDFDCTKPAQMVPGSSIYAFGTPVNPMSLARRAARFFTPQPLYAAAFFGIVGGSRDYLSPSSVYDLDLLQLGGLGTIADGKTKQALKLTTGGDIELTVSVVQSAGGGFAPDGTPVTVSIVGNSSSVAFFKDGPDAKASATVTRYVQGGFGVVSFADLYLTKAGGYQIAFQIAFDGFGGPMLPSNSFNMQNK